MSIDFDIIEKGNGSNTSVEILRYKQLLGSNDVKTAEMLFYANQAGMSLKQVHIILNGGEALMEAGLLHFMKGHISIENKVGGLGGLAKKLATNALTSESTFKPTYKGTGELYLEPTFGHFIVAQLQSEEMIVDKGMFVACESTVEVGVATQRNISSALLGGESFFQTRLSGSGWCVLSSPVPADEVMRLQLNNEKLSVDGNFALLRKGKIEFKVEKSTKSLIGSTAGGEGMLQTFTGTGEVWLAPTQSVYERIRYEGLTRLTQVSGSMGQTTK